MKEILIISGTDKSKTKTKLLAEYYQKRLFELKGLECPILCLNDLFYPNKEIIQLEEEVLNIKPEEYAKIAKRVIEKHDKIIFILPEYNGSISGVLKKMIDDIPEYEIWKNKKACLTGISGGRAGNLRGMDHLSDILNHLKVNVYWNKLPISNVGNIIKIVPVDIDKTYNIIIEKATEALIDAQIFDFLNF